MIIGIHGKAKAGKDTAADYLHEQYGFSKYSFADPIKLIIMDAFQWEHRHCYGDLKDVVDPKYGFSPRVAMQLFGTEFGRRLNPDLWLVFAEEQINQFSLNGGQSFVIPDVRFENEASFIRNQGGVVWHIHRPGNDNCVGVGNHQSEAGIEFRDGDIRIVNDRSVEDLHLNIDTIMMINKVEKVSANAG